MNAKAIALLAALYVALTALILFYTHKFAEQQNQVQSQQFATMEQRFAGADQRLSAINQQVAVISKNIDRELEQSRLLSPADLGNSRADVRIYAINSQLRQATSPVVVVGDSITEGALLPSTICGHPVINAGIGGMTPSSYTELVETEGLLSDMNAALLVVALGTNNAQTLASLTGFSAEYLDLLKLLAPRSEKIVLVGAPPIQDGAIAQYFDRSRISEINQTIASIAADKDASFLSLDIAMPTVDGVHLQAAGYERWLSSITGIVKSRLGCSESNASQ